MKVSMCWLYSVGVSITVQWFHIFGKAHSNLPARREVATYAQPEINKEVGRTWIHLDTSGTTNRCIPVMLY